jgi:hypothetical protein
MIKKMKLAVVIFEGDKTGYMKFKAGPDDRIFRFGEFEIVEEFHLDCLVSVPFAKGWCERDHVDPRYSVREVDLSVDLPPVLKFKLG